MADEEEKTEDVQETVDGAAEESATPDSPPASESDAAPSSDAQDDSPPTAGEEQESDAAPASEPQAVVAPKERKRRSRAAKAAPARQQVTPEERQAERVARRARKAAVRQAGRARTREKERARRHEAPETPAREHQPGKQKTRQGVVVSDRADKTITVRIDTARRHRRYEKIVRTSRTLHAHDEQNDAGIGDTVIVRESRPLSRTKRWRLIQVVEKAK
jgi:small subunit ribosomal protein S17